MINKPPQVIPGHPFDYQHARHPGSWLLRCCAMCGGELEYLGETPDGARERERNEDYWEIGDGADCVPTHKYNNRDSGLDEDDHDRCQCEGRRVRDTVPAPPDLECRQPSPSRLVTITEPG